MRSKVKLIGAVGGVALGLSIGLIPIAGLSAQGSVVLGILAWAICWWVFSVLPEYATALLMAVLLVTFGHVEGESVFGAFSSSTWWLLVGAFGLGTALQRSGLLERMARKVVEAFPLRFSAQSFAIMLVGTLVGPFIPAMNAKTAMLAPLARQMGDSLGYRPFSKPMTGLFLSMLVGVRNVAPAVLSASVAGYVVLGLMPEHVQDHFTMLNWFLAALPWFLFVLVVNYLLIVLIYGRRQSGGSEETQKGGDAKERWPSEQSATSKFGGLFQGSPSSLEKWTGAIVVVTVVLWATESWHGLPAYLVAIAALCACVAIGVIDRKIFRSDIIWDSLLFTGVVLGLGPVFSQVGIDSWIVSLVSPVIAGVSGQPYLFVAAIAIATVLIRFVIASELAFLNVFLAFMVPVAMSLGVNPWIVGFSAYALVGPWFTLYQNPVYLAGFFAVDGEMSRHVDNAKYCVLYCVVSIAGLLASIPYWEACGLYWL